MSAPRVGNSAFIGAAWFAVLLAACIYAESRNLPQSAAPPSAVAGPVVPDDVPQAHAVRRPAGGLEELLGSRGSTGRQGLPIDAPLPAAVSELPPATTVRPVVPTSQPERARAAAAPVEDEVIADPPASEPAIAWPLRLPPQVLTVPEGLSFTVNAPAAAVEQEPVLFTIRVANPGPAPVDGVTIVANFDDSWEYPGSEEHTLEQRLGRLPADSVHEALLSLTPLRTGRNRVDFRVDGPTSPPDGKTVWCEVHVRMIELGIAGPPRRSVGQRAEYVVTIVNTSGRDLPESLAGVEYNPDALAVREASVGWVVGPGTISWPLGTLVRDERVQIQLEFETIDESRRTPVRGSFATAGRTAALREAALEIVPQAAVDVSIVDDDDPRTVGDAARFTIHIRNRTPAALENLELRITTSPHLENLQLADDARSVSTAIARDPYGVELHDIRIPLGGELSFGASARACRPGEGMIRVLVRANGLPAPFEVEESLLVNPALPTGAP